MKTAIPYSEPTLDNPLCWSAFREQVKLGALRWLHGLDLDPDSITYGVADREFWSWKTKDFANGTWQGGLAGFLDAAELLDLTEAQYQKIIEATLRGTRFIQRNDGSFEEAYPFESSYCVTALVLFNLLYAYFSYPSWFPDNAKTDLEAIVLQGNRFLLKTPETHGIISNHLATGAAALYFVDHFYNRTNSNAFSTFLTLQHPTEDWFPEYGNADPGYQTLLNHYLLATHVAVRLPDPAMNALNRSYRFVNQFCFPNASFAGEIGSRGTGIVYPSGTVALDETGTPRMTSMLAWFLKGYAANGLAVSPTAVDAGNFVPVFNAWTLILKLFPKLASVSRPEPAPESVVSVAQFQDAKLWVARSENAMLVFSPSQGVIRKVLASSDGQDWQDESYVAFTQDGWTTQGNPVDILEQTGTRLSFQLKARRRNQPLNTAFSAMALRLMNLALFPFPAAQRLMKKWLAHVVMQRNSEIRTVPIQVTIGLDDPSFPVTVRMEEEGWQYRRYGYHRHMASANAFEQRAL